MTDHPETAARKAEFARLPPDVAEGLRAQYQAATAYKPEFDAAIRDVARELGCARDPLTGDLKGVDRAAAKVMSDYDGDAKRIKDLLRATLVMDSIHDARRAIERLGARFDAKIVNGKPSAEDLASGRAILAVKRNTLDPDLPPDREDGYRDVLMNLHADGHTYEIQANVQEMLIAKKEAHAFYGAAEAISRRAKNENRDLAPEEDLKRAALVTKQQEIYDAAWSATIARNLSSDNRVASLNRWADMSLGSDLSHARTAPPGYFVSGISSQSPNFVPSGNLSGSSISDPSTNTFTLQIIAQMRKAEFARLPPDVADGLRAQYQAATAYKPEFDAAIRDVARELGCARDPLTGDLKGVDRAAAKVMSDYDGDAKRIKDLLRATLVMDSIHDARRAIERLGARFDAKIVAGKPSAEDLASGQAILTVKRNTLDPDLPPDREDGYRDVLMNLHVDGHTYEIQANVQEMLIAKKEAHAFYEEAEKIRRTIESKNREGTPEEIRRHAELIKDQQTIYASAWTDATRERNSVSVSMEASPQREASPRSAFSLSQRNTTSVGDIDSGISSQSPNFVPSGNLSGSSISNPSTDTSTPRIIAQMQAQNTSQKESSMANEEAKSWTKKEAEKQAEWDIENLDAPEQAAPLSDADRQWRINNIGQRAETNPHYKAVIEEVSPGLLEQSQHKVAADIDLPAEAQELETLRMRVRSEADVLETPEDSRSELLATEALDGRGREYNFETGREELEALRSQTAGVTPEDSRSEILAAEAKAQREADEEAHRARDTETQAAIEERIRRAKEREQREYMDGLMDMDNRTGRELGKDEFITPRSVAQKYVAIEGKFYTKDTKSPRVVFEDMGNKLRTSSTDRAAIADMVTLAKAKQWNSLKLTGSREFRREAWLQAESLGIKTKGYTPKEADLAALEAMRQERSTNDIQPVRERQAERAKAQATAPRHDLNKNQAQMHVAATENTAANLEALKKNPALANKSAEALEKLAYWRGIVQEDVKREPQAAQGAALAKFDKAAENPEFLQRLEKSDNPAQEQTTQERETHQKERKDTQEQSL